MRVLLAGPDFEENLSIQAERHETSLAVFNSTEDVETVAEQAGETDLVGCRFVFSRVAQEFLSSAQQCRDRCPLTVHGKLVNRIVVVLTFDKNGKVHSGS